MEYEHVYHWSKTVELISNRVHNLNWMLSTADGSAACRLRYKGGSYNVYIAGHLFATFRVYDCRSADLALARVSALSDGLWLCRRSSLSFTVS